MEFHADPSRLCTHSLYSVSHYERFWQRCNLYLHAVYRGDNAQIKLYLDHGWDVDSGQPLPYVEEPASQPLDPDVFPLDGGKPDPALNIAVFQGHKDTIKLLLDHGADLTRPMLEDPARTPLLLAAVSGNAEIVRLLLSYAAPERYSANPHDRGKPWEMQYYDPDYELNYAMSFITPLTVLAFLPPKCSTHDHLKIAKALYQENHRIKFEQKDLEIYWSGHEDHEVEVKQRCYERQPSVLFLAACHGNLSLAEWLISMSADVESRGSGNEAAIATAARSNHTAMVRLLLEHGADPNAQYAQVNRFSPLVSAMESGNVTMAKDLLSFGATIDPRDRAKCEEYFQLVTNDRCLSG